MIPELILKTSDRAVQDFILDHADDDERALVLRHKEILGLSSAWVAQQIAGRRRIKSKLPSWWKTPGVIYPPTINLEQCSSEATAKYKASTIGGANGVDLTGGFGVDTFFLSQKCDQMFYVEPDENLFFIARHNHRLLGVNNINHVLGTAEDFFTQSREQLDFCFIDPSRRIRQQKVFRFADCVPNVVEMMPDLLKGAKKILVKASPLMDLRQGSIELKSVSRITILAVENECKEVLFEEAIEGDSPVPIHAIELDENASVLFDFQFSFEDEQKATSEISSPLKFIYEFNAAILKAGAFKLAGMRYGLKKLHVNTQLYTSNELLEKFPGRIFKIRASEKLDKKLASHFPGNQANILTRNFPLSVDEIKKKTGLTEGGTLYLICTQSIDRKEVLVAERIQ